MQKGHATSKLPEKGGFAGILVLIVVLVVAIGAGIAIGTGVHFWKKSGEKPVVQSPSPSPADETANWRTYTNSKLGFSIKYPRTISRYKGEWEYEEFGDNSVMFRPSSIREDYLWGVYTYGNKTIENLIAETGNQFDDRKVEKRNITVNGKDALLVIVTTDSIKDWFSETIYIENEGKIFDIGNGAREEPEFDLFYNSFRFTE